MTGAEGRCNVHYRGQPRRLPAKMKKKFVVVGIGEVLWDMLPSGKQLGGAPANFAYFAKALGAEAYMVSRVGRDRLGREILDRFNRSGFSRKYIVVDHSHPTGIVEVRLDRNGKPSYDIKRNVAWDFIGLSSKLRSLAERTNAVCFGTLAQRSAITRQTVREFIAAMPETSLKVFDINLRQAFYTREIIERLLKFSNVFKLNDEELRIIADLLSIPGDEAGLVKSLMLKYRLEVVALTKGPQGAVLYSPAGAYPVKGMKTRIVDTVGAGDAFTAALVMGLLQGLKMDKIGKFANRLAGYVCGQHGATPPLPVGNSEFAF